MGVLLVLTVCDDDESERYKDEKWNGVGGLCERNGKSQKQGRYLLLECCATPALVFLWSHFSRRSLFDLSNLSSSVVFLMLLQDID